MMYHKRFIYVYGIAAGYCLGRHVLTDPFREWFIQNRLVFVYPDGDVSIRKSVKRFVYEYKTRNGCSTKQALIQYLELKSSGAI